MFFFSTQVVFQKMPEVEMTLGKLELEATCECSPSFCGLEHCETVVSSLKFNDHLQISGGRMGLTSYCKGNLSWLNTQPAMIAQRENE